MPVAPVWNSVPFRGPDGCPLGGLRNAAKANFYISRRRFLLIIHREATLKTCGEKRLSLERGFPQFLGRVMKSFETLWKELKLRQASGDENSGTVRALAKGPHFIGKKILEEAGEVWMAAEYETTDRCAEEMSQLLYHLQVMMLAKGISLEDVYRHL